MLLSCGVIPHSVCAHVIILDFRHNTIHTTSQVVAGVCLAQGQPWAHVPNANDPPLSSQTSVLAILAGLKQSTICFHREFFGDLSSKDFIQHQQLFQVLLGSCEIWGLLNHPWAFPIGFFHPNFDQFRSSQIKNSLVSIREPCISAHSWNDSEPLSKCLPVQPRCSENLTVALRPSPGLKREGFCSKGDVTRDLKPWSWGWAGRKRVNQQAEREQQRGRSCGRETGRQSASS